MELSPELKQDIIDWIVALRSGKFTQFRGSFSDALYGVIETPTKHCCLAVFGDIKGISNHKRDGEDWGTGSVIYHNKYRKFFDQTCENGDSLSSRLIIMNDNEGKSYLDIADYLEQKFITGK